MQDARIILRQFNTWGVRRSHSWSRKSKLVVAMAAMKVFLNVWIAHLAALILWLWGSTIWSLYSFLKRLKGFLGKLPHTQLKYYYKLGQWETHASR
jgi:hypothetical protein